MKQPIFYRKKTLIWNGLVPQERICSSLMSRTKLRVKRLLSVKCRKKNIWTVFLPSLPVKAFGCFYSQKRINNCTSRRMITTLITINELQFICWLLLIFALYFLVCLLSLRLKNGGFFIYWIMIHYTRVIIFYLLLKDKK